MPNTSPNHVLQAPLLSDPQIVRGGSIGHGCRADPAYSQMQVFFYIRVRVK